MSRPKPVSKTDAEWKKLLSSEEYRIMRERGTEAPFTGAYHDAKAKGMYQCRACGQKLFDSQTKFDSGTGWPSFDQAIPGSVNQRQDTSHGMNRVEVTCANCGSHLGHIFDDGPTPTGRRYCINSACLHLEPKP